MKWVAMNPSGKHPNGSPGHIALYDKNSGKVFVHDDANLYAYDLAANTYTTLLQDVQIDYHLTGVIDTKRKKMILIGGGEQWVIDISGATPKQEKLGSTGATSLIASVYPGLAYDPVTDRVVAWNGGDSVYVLNLDTREWSTISYPKGPGAAFETGTFHRWSYVPSQNGFVVVNDVRMDAYFFRWNGQSSLKSRPTRKPVKRILSRSVLGKSIKPSFFHFGEGF
jgi:hypothetical protein